MSENSVSGPNIAPASSKALTSSRLASFKHYVAQRDYKATYKALSSRVRGNSNDRSRQTWDQWARYTLRRPSSFGAEVKVHLFPGWAVRRFKDPRTIFEEGAPFNLEIYVSGFASSIRPPEAATRSQRAFYRLAKSYAALPKLPAISTPNGDASLRQARLQRLIPSSHLRLSNLQPDPSETTEQVELDVLDAQLKAISVSSASSSADDSECSDEATSTTQDDSSDVPSRDNIPDPEPLQAASDLGTSVPLLPEDRYSKAGSFWKEITDHAIQQLHANLDERLRLFWSSAASNKTIRLSIFCPVYGDCLPESQDILEGQEAEPLAVMDVTTSAQGAFQTTFKVPWERLVTYPPALQFAFGKQDIEYPVIVQAEVRAQSFPMTPSSSLPSSAPGSPRQLSTPLHPPSPLLSPLSLSSSPTTPRSVSPAPSNVPSIKSQITLSLSLPHVAVRLISDIDDTIKHAGILQGSKRVFQNVFARNLEEVVIHNMADWYRGLWHRGVRFHYVSNSPFELLPVLTEFLQVSLLPEASIKLKSYDVRSLFPALLSAPAARKRPGVVEVLDAFPESRFILVGDTGQQDLELYTDLARERPYQVVAVLLRDVTATAETSPATPMTSPPFFDAGNRTVRKQKDRRVVEEMPQPIEGMPSMETLRGPVSSSWTASAGETEGASGRQIPRSHSPFDSQPTASDPFSYFSSAHPRSLRTGTPPLSPSYQARYPSTIFPRRKSSAGITLDERRQNDLQMRIARARADIPSHIVFRVFCEPNECVEVQHILDRYQPSDPTRRDR